MIDFSRLCSYGSRMLDPIPGVDGAALLWAIGTIESARGKHAVPRYEPAFGWKGRYANTQQRRLLREHGDLAASSLGPWQVMYCNVWTVTGGMVTPLEMYQPATAMMVTVLWMNSNILARGAKTVAEIADAWNSGNHKDSNVPHAYIAKVQAEYDARVNQDVTT